MSVSIGDHFKEAGLLPRFHGNGFTQLYLDHSHRLHVWHPLLPMPEENNATVHDHMWDMASQVLVGQVGHLTYDVQAVDGETQYDMYSINQPEAPRQAHNDVVFTFMSGATVQSTGHYMMQTGSIYHFKAGYFHESVANPGQLSATLLRKNKDILEYPRLIVPTGEAPYQAFGVGTQPPEADMWEAIKEALEAMPESVKNHLVNMVKIVSNDNEG